MNVQALFTQCAQHYGRGEAVRDEASRRSLNFIELQAALAAVDVQLDAAGVDAGERVALLGRPNLAYLLCDYGVMASGRVRVPMDPGLSAQEQAAQIADSGARLLIFDEIHRERAAELARLVPRLAARVQAEFLDRAASAPGKLRVGPDADQLASLSYTGGTTGNPKAVMITHGSLTAAVQNIVGARGMAPGDILLNVRPAWPIAALVLLAHLAVGGTVVLSEKFEPCSFMRQLQTLRAAATSLVPTHLARLMDEVDPADYDLAALRTIDVGAASIPPALFERLVRAFGPRISVLYGLTEAPWSCYLPARAFDAAPEVRQRLMGTVGRALFGVEVCIRSVADGMPMATGEEGEVTLRGSHLTRGYWNQPELTAAVLRDGWFHTGDLGIVDGDGYLRITGRIKELIRTGGKTVVPAEVEAVLMRHPAVVDAVVLGLADPEWGEVVAAMVVRRPGHESTSPETLIEWCREHLSSFKKPRRIVFVEAIPRSHYGKPMRGKLLEQFRNLV